MYLGNVTYIDAIVWFLGGIFQRFIGRWRSLVLVLRNQPIKIKLIL